MKEFSTIYGAYHQRRFRELLEKGDLEKAVETLERMPTGLTTLERIDRLRVIIEGYKMIINNYSKISNLQSAQDPHSLVDITDRLRAYEEIGTPEEFRELKKFIKGL